MQKIKTKDINKFILITSFALVTLFLVLNLFYLLKIFGVENHFNYIDKDIYVSWLHRFINPKNFFKLFYNFSIIFLPLSSILLTIKISHFIKRARVFFIGILTGFMVFMLLFYLQSVKTLGKLIVADIISLLFGIAVYFFFNRLSNSLFKLNRIVDKNPTKLFEKINEVVKRIPKELIRFIQKNHFWILLILLLIVLINFAYLLETGIWINYYHHNYFIATINDLIQGKHILVDTFNQYGLFWPLSFYFLFTTIVPFSYMNFYLLLMVFTYIDRKSVV